MTKKDIIYIAVILVFGAIIMFQKSDNVTLNQKLQKYNDIIYQADKSNTETDSLLYEIDNNDYSNTDSLLRILEERYTP